MTEAIFTVNSPCTRASIAPYCDRVRERVSVKRFEHIVRVAILTETIAQANRFSEDEVRAASLAATLHDVARDLSADELFALAPPQTELERNHPMSVHGRAGRRIIEGWGVNDERVLEAVEGHVFGVSYGNRVGMAVYIADVSEPGRGVNEDIRALAMNNLRWAYKRAVDSKVRYLQAKGRAVHPDTLRVYRELCAEG